MTGQPGGGHDRAALGNAGAGAAPERRRFVAPARGQVDPACFRHPLFDGYAAHRGWMTAATWPGIDALNAASPRPGPRFVAQDRALLADGLHYEARIATQGRVATRLENWHDLFNALVWLRHPAIKSALNARQCRHIAAMGPQRRNRAQQALTQFDECGVIVRVADPALLPLWDGHRWSELFAGQAARWWDGGIAVAAVIGHALMEQALAPGLLLVGRCVVVQGGDDAACVARVAASPKRSRPAKSSAIRWNCGRCRWPRVPGWHPRQDAAFHAQAGYFRPLRAGREYPPPLREAQERM
ncbi:DUF3025 domain-containing protein [Stenotrophomonas nitritireducens]|uniref:DUF3025 domain-containing protein n=1 Tax=Stenotrophomonas nitritireducens TaxID=83617 RepID=UPI003D98BC29